MYKILFNKRNIIAFVLLVLVFSLGTYWIRSKMHHQYETLSQSVIHGSTSGYQKFLNHYFSGYQRLLNELEQTMPDSLVSASNTKRYLHTLLQTDSTIVAIGICNSFGICIVQNDSVTIQDSIAEKMQFQFHSKLSSRVINQQYLFLGDSINQKTPYQIGIVVDLYRLHEKFIWDNIYTSVYQVVIDQNGDCIYHPEINQVGKSYQLPDYLFKGDNGYNYEQFNKLHTAQSTYLQLPVYKEYSRMPFLGNEWVIVSVSPGFEVKDMIADQERNTIMMFVLFLGTLLGILMFGIWHWKREFLLRSSAEQENLNLMLKNEKQKSETFSIKLELLRSGLNSHFMFNSLGTVKALLSKDDAIARKMLSNLSHLYRYQLRIEGEPMVTLSDELHFTQTYVDVINLRMNSSIQLHIDIPTQYYQWKVLPVSLQLLVENCIKHNVATESNPLLIRLEVKDERIYVINELRPKVAIVETNGKGLQNLNTRYMLITQKECSFTKENGQFIACIPIIQAI